MTCAEFREWVGRVLDGHVAAGERDAFSRHMSACAGCRREYELEAVAKDVVRRNVDLVRVPSDLRRSIRSAVRAEAGLTGTRFWERLRDSFSLPAIAVTVAVFLIAFLLVPTHPSSDDRIRHTAENDVMHQAAENFALVRDGKLKPALTSCSPEAVYGYLASQQVPFEVHVRPLERCDGYSAMVNDYHGVRLAHVVYRIGKELLYVYQVKKGETDGTADHLTMPLAAREAIDANRWYTDPQHPDCNLLVWEENGTVCAAASSMNKERMLSVLASR